MSDGQLVGRPRQKPHFLYPVVSCEAADGVGGEEGGKRSRQACLSPLPPSLSVRSSRSLSWSTLSLPAPSVCPLDSLSPSGVVRPDDGAAPLPPNSVVTYVPRTRPPPQPVAGAGGVSAARIVTPTGEWSEPPTSGRAHAATTRPAAAADAST